MTIDCDRTVALTSDGTGMIGDLSPDGVLRGLAALTSAADFDRD